MVWVLLIGCPSTAPESTDTDTDTDPTDTEVAGPTGDSGTPAPQTIDASCEATDNPLRVACQATMSAAGPVTLELVAPGASSRTFASDADAFEHDFLAWGLEPSTLYEWTIGTASGEVATGPLPPVFDTLDIDVTGSAWGFDAVLVPLTCSSQVYFTMIEPDGDLVWFVANDVWNSNLRGYEWAAESQSLLTHNAGLLVEQHVSGAELLRLERGVHFDHDLHHDMARFNGLTYSLYERRVGSLDVDGIYVFDGPSLVGDFRLDDHFAITGGGGIMNDWSHANGLNVTDQGELVMSLLEFDTVLGIDGDPHSPTFLDLRWNASGSPYGLPDPEYVAIEGPLEGFSGQHNASRHGDLLWVFDNDGAGDGSRAARFVMDHGAGTLTLDAAWDLGGTCPIQGGALPLEGGGALVTCTSASDIRAFREGATEADWTLRATCGGGLLTLPPNRAIPVTIE